MKTAIEQATYEYLQLLERNANKDAPSERLRYTFEIQPGSKYLKVTQTLGGSNLSVHSFIEKATGNILKPATWKAPVKDARYNLFSDMALLYKVADPYGGYLYKSTAEANRA